MVQFTSNKTIIAVGVLIVITVLTALYMLVAIELKDSPQRDPPRMDSSSANQIKHTSKRRSSTAAPSAKGQAQ